MKRILLLTIAPLVFLSAISAQITREEADRIVQEYMEGKTPPYFIRVCAPRFTPYEPYDGVTITTWLGEEIELGYSCWAYYVDYSDWVNPRSDSSLRCLIVNASNGNLLEINVKDINFNGSNYKYDWGIWRGAREGCDCRDELFYYERGGHSDNYWNKVFLDYSFANDCLLVAFYPQVQNEEKIDYLNSTGFFNMITRIPTNCRHSKDHILCAYTEEKKTCSQLKEIISILEKSPLVAYANLTFSDYVYTEDFVVVLNDINDFPYLEAMMQETNTRLIKEISDERWYVLNADKNSKGDALQMSRYFFETGKFALAIPSLIPLTIFCPY